MKLHTPLILAVGLLTAPSLQASPTRPGDPPVVDSGPRGDGVYGRFDGDFSFSVAAGAEVDLSGGAHFRPAVQVNTRFYQLVGAYGGFAQSIDSGDPLERLLSLGLLIEPLFLLRWSDNAQSGRPTADLVLDSLSLGLGGFLAEPRGGTLGQRGGLELGLGIGVPLLATAPGPWLRARGSLRASDIEASAVVQLYFEWQAFWESGWTD